METTKGKRREINITVSLRPEVKSALGKRAERNGRADKREAEKLIEQALGFEINGLEIERT